MPINFKAIAGSLCALGALLVLSLLARPAAERDDASAGAPAALLDAFGIEADAYRVEEQPIRRNQTFSEILGAYRVAPEAVHRLAELARPLFDVRHLRAGKTLRIYQEESEARLVVYQADPVRYVVFDLRDSLAVYQGHHPVTITQRAAGGTITSSLYQTLDAQGADPALALQLSQVFAWQIDFYRIQHDDAFEVIYEERTIDGQPAGTERILAARFEHAGKTYYAFRFGDDERGSYYDENGNALRRAFLKAPLEYSRISSRYSRRRFHPVQKRYKAHLGTDYAAPTGTPVRATGDGVVMAAAYTRGNGRYVKIRHNGTYATGYLHLSKIARGIRPGTRVQQGQVIGYVGQTGLATGPHLCYRFWKDGVQIDPLRLELPAAEPLAATQRGAFFAVRDYFLPLLYGGQPAAPQQDAG